MTGCLDKPHTPAFLYGTAWKEGRTAGLTELALRAGFRGHRYRQPAAALLRSRSWRGIGGGLSRRHCEARRSVSADQVHLPARTGPSVALRSGGQSGGSGRSISGKFAGASGDRLRRQLSCCTGLRPHSDWTGARRGSLGSDAKRARCWAHAAAGRQQRLAAASGTDGRAVTRSCLSFVQNRCFARLGWDREVRAFCNERKIVYQGFSLLTANPEVLQHPPLDRSRRETECNSGAGCIQLRASGRNCAAHRHIQRRTHDGRILPASS